jgi:hypothetical protein
MFLAGAYSGQDWMLALAVDLIPKANGRPDGERPCWLVKRMSYGHER